jgi:hypothetical protein
MNGENSANRDALLESFAAELTLAAYRVALRTRARGTWLDLVLGLWRALAEKVKTWGRANGLGAALLHLANLATRPFGPTAQPSPVGANPTLL